MPKYTEVFKLFKKVDYKKAIKIVFDNIVLSEIEYILKQRLSEKGITASGIQLKTNKHIKSGVYSAFTIKQKQSKNKRYDIVTLNETGEFYKTFKASVLETGILTTADLDIHRENIYLNFTNLFKNANKFLSEITGLNESEKNELINEVIKELFIENIKHQFKRLI